MRLFLPCCVLFTLLLGLSSLGRAQSNVLSGYVKDSETGVHIVGAIVKIHEINKGAESNHFGFYSMSINTGTHVVSAYFPGYMPYKDTLRISRVQGTTHEIYMRKLEIFETEVYDSTFMNISADYHNLSRSRHNAESTNAMAYFGEERDLLKYMHYLPGVAMGKDGTAEMYVRGGGNEQNLILFDGVQLYNTSHAFNYLSIFESQQINNVDFYKGGFPARYGGRLSSVMDMTLTEGSNTGTFGNLSLGLLSAKFDLNGPLGSPNSKTSYAIAARRSWIDMILAPIDEDDEFFDFSYYFYDLNARLTHRMSDKSYLSMTYYQGRNLLSYDLEEYFSDLNGMRTNDLRINYEVPWGNRLAVLNWYNQINSRTMSSFTLGYTDYNTFQDLSFFLASRDSLGRVSSTQGFDHQFDSKLRDITFKSDFEQHLNDQHAIRYGVQYINRSSVPFSTYIAESQNQRRVRDTTLQSNQLISHETSLYLEDDMDLGNGMHLNAGLRYTYFLYSSNSYHFLEPRLVFSKLMNPQTVVAFSYSRMSQFVHKIRSNSFLGLTYNDIWFPAGDLGADPMRSHQITGGVKRKLKNKPYELTMDLFYKTMSNLIELSDGNSFQTTEGAYAFNNITRGEGYAYGAEFSVMKMLGRTTGRLSATFSRSFRTFDNINSGTMYRFEFDRPVDVSLNINHTMSETYQLLFNVVYASGLGATVPVGDYIDINRNLAYVYSERNAYSLPDYFRIDVGVHRFYNRSVMGNNPYQSLKLSLYNATGFHNVVNAFPVFNEDGALVLRTESFFKFFPGIVYSYHF